MRRRLIASGRPAPPSAPERMAAGILVLCGPIWLGDNASVTKLVIERLYACSTC